MNIKTPTSLEIPEEKVHVAPLADPGLPAGNPASAEDMAREEAARQAEAGKVTEIRQGLGEKTEKPLEEYPEDHAVKAAKVKYQKEHLELENINLALHLDNLIKEYSSQSNPEAQAEKAVMFEAVLDYCIKNGKTTVKTITRTVILGLAEGIIRHEHLGYYQRYVNQMPPLEFLLSGNQLNLKKMAKEFRGRGGEKKFQDFYWTKVLRDPRVTARIQKSAPANEWDHDFVAEIAPGGDQNVAKLMATRPEGQTSIENAYAGSLKWLQANLKRTQKESPQNARRMLGFFLMSDGILSNRAYQNVVPIKGEKPALNDQTRKNVPRMSGQLFGREMNLGQIDDTIWSMIAPLESNLFALLKKPDLSLDELKNYLQKKYNFQINSFDDFYDNIDVVLKKILPDQELRKGSFLTRWLGLVK